MPEGQVLEFSRVTKRFGAVTAVSDLSVRVEPGRVTGFLGPNGAGKTTSLRILLGQIRPTSGTATIGGQSYSELRHPLRTVGAVLEEAAYRPRRTAARQLMIAAKANGIPSSRVDEVLRLVGLQDDADTRLGSYSLGMRQRLTVAAALLGDPGVLVLDEPANGLDPEGIRWMRLLMRRLADEGRTVLLSSHVLSEIEQVADDVVVLSKGQAVYSGAIADLASPAGGAVIVDAANRAPLITALSAAKLDFDVLRSGVTVRGSDAATVGAITVAAGVPLTMLQQRGPSLEEVFLDLVYGRRADSPRLDEVANPVAHAPVTAEGTAADAALVAGAAPLAGAAAVVAAGSAGVSDAATGSDAADGSGAADSSDAADAARGASDADGEDATASAGAGVGSVEDAAAARAGDESTAAESAETAADASAADVTAADVSAADVSAADVSGTAADGEGITASDDAGAPAGAQTSDDAAAPATDAGAQAPSADEASAGERAGAGDATASWTGTDDSADQDESDSDGASSAATGVETAGRPESHSTGELRVDRRLFASAEAAGCSASHDEPGTDAEAGPEADDADGRKPEEHGETHDGDDAAPTISDTSHGNGDDDHRAEPPADEASESDQQHDYADRAERMAAAVAALWAPRSASGDEAVSTDDKASATADEASTTDEASSDAETTDATDAENERPRILPLATEAITLPTSSELPSFTSLITGLPATVSEGDDAPATEAIPVFTPHVSHDDDEDAVVDDADDDPRLAAMRTSLSRAASRFFHGEAPDYPYGSTPASGQDDSQQDDGDQRSEEGDRPQEG